MPFVGYINWLKNSGGQLSTVVQDLSLHTTVHLMGGLKSESSLDKQPSVHNVAW